MKWDKSMRYILGILFLLNIQPVFGVQQASSSPTVESKTTLSPPLPSWWKRGWGLTIYSGPLTSQTTSKIPMNPNFEGSAILAITGFKELGRVLERKLGFELETQLVQHFRGQTHLEINPIVLILRWWRFPWNHIIPTTLAVGDGLSIATQIPKYELTRRGSGECARVLNYVMAELTLSVPSLPHWALVGRYHHRSGAFGLFYGVHDASTAFAAGLKYWF